MLTPEPIIDPFPAWKLTLCHKDKAKYKRQEMTLAGGFGCLELCLHGIREHHDSDQSEHSMSWDLDQ